MREPISLRVLQTPAMASDARDTSRPVMLVGFQNQGNLGLGYLAAVLRQYGYSVHVVDIEQGNPPRPALTPLELTQSLLSIALIVDRLFSHSNNNGF